MGVVNLADDRPLAFYPQQVEEVGETKSRNVDGIDASISELIKSATSD